MKYISQERLKEIAAILKIGVLEKCLIDSLVAECQEIDTLTVSKLRPMCDAPKNDDSVFAAYKDKTGSISFDITSGNRIEEQSCFLTEEYIGWIPVIKPIYKPEE